VLQKIGPLYFEYDAVFDWPADDPHLFAPADRTERWMAKRSAASAEGARSVQDPTIAHLVATSFGATCSAVWRPSTWRGWIAIGGRRFPRTP